MAAASLYYCLEMTTYRRARKQLERELAAAKIELPVDPLKINGLEVELKILESDRLREKARRWDFDLVGSEVGSWEARADDNRYYLKQDKQYALAEKLIRDAQYQWVKKWVDLLSPIASVVISILAFALALVALYLQLSGKLH